MISPESPSSMTFGYGVRVLYCTLYDLSWLSRQHDAWIWREGRALYLYMILTESPSSMTLGYSVRDVHSTCIWLQVTLQAVWRWDLVWGSCTVPLLYMISAESQVSWVSRQHDVGIWCEGPVLYLYMTYGRALYLYMISAESPGSMTLGSGVRVLYCTCIWS